jgi:hemerythrin-like domain-containing protein
MLTTTYSLATLSVEQKNARSILAKLQQHIRAIWQDLQGVNHACIASTLIRLEQFEEYCHRRKVEAYLIPAIRKNTHEADGILAELESLSSSAVRILQSMQEQLKRAYEHGVQELNKLGSAMDLYCNNLLTRLTREEEELFPLVRELLPTEEWFQIAARFLSEDAGKRRVAPALPFAVPRT